MIIELIEYGIVALCSLMAFSGFLSIRAVIENYGVDEEFYFFFRYVCIFGGLAAILNIIQIIITEGGLCIC